ncbi:hypothetical protein BMG00_11085 [Thioclava marina]|uniref:Uncharacterized protein n=2 Tax=Thioclava TaxID=285107 RepID=A0A085TVC7_9RHOB|nr:MULTISPECIES: hypothetical protein [Thioclava]KFE34674.1 hypothetical protein DW2_12505 [Thioclava atlantica]OOY11644.1 hypothetical protein BMG00_11085 [Thioclava marina]
MPRKDKLNGFFRELAPKPGTAQDKTDAAVRIIREAEAEKRADLTATLRAARLERDEGDHDLKPPSRRTKPRS